MGHRTKAAALCGGLAPAYFEVQESERLALESLDKGKILSTAQGKSFRKVANDYEA